MFNRRSRLLKLFAIAACVALTATGFWTYQRYQARDNTPQLDEIIERAKHISLDDRQAWLQLARQALAAEHVQPIAPPNDPVNNRGNTPRAELGRLLFFDPIL